MSVSHTHTKTTTCPQSHDFLSFFVSFSSFHLFIINDDDDDDGKKLGMREHYVCDTEVNLCYSNPCLNGGRCLRKEGGYTCQCQPGYAGDDCQLDLSGSASASGGGGGKKDRTCNGRTGLCAPTNCTGPANFYTPLTCQLRSRSFYRGSFLTFPALRQRYRLHLKLR